eukprot:TRINITY_DN15706_c0_g1_i1.p1 TRINITY_DN15706_c0_g1~~TRINITY_DN15706_c0_g1_i1.p1  ORF type:complete len:160 (-),score=15.56 TRINITY_DN15706_c0_g1_i1:42-521(-)
MGQDSSKILRRVTSRRKDKKTDKNRKKEKKPLGSVAGGGKLQDDTANTMTSNLLLQTANANTTDTTGSECKKSHGDSHSSKCDTEGRGISHHHSTYHHPTTSHHSTTVHHHTPSYHSSSTTHHPTSTHHYTPSYHSSSHTTSYSHSSGFSGHSCGHHGF